MPAPHSPLRIALLAVAISAVSPAHALQAPLQQRVEAGLAAAPAGTRFGLVVTTEDGRELVAVNPDARFIPASNTKMLTTAAAFANMTALDRPDAAGGASVRLDGSRRSPDVILAGHGDARLSSAPDCAVDCLAALADAVAARTRRVRNVVGDDSLFPDQRWSPGMSWNNIQSRYGTGVSALTLDDNELAIRVTPGAVGERPALDMLPYYEVTNLATTAAAGTTELQFERMPNSRVLRLTGTIAVGAEPETLRMGIDDPAHFAAWRLRTLLEARGVRVTGDAEARHRPFARGGDRGDDVVSGRAPDGLGPVRRLGHVDLQSPVAPRGRHFAALGRRPALGRGVAGDLPGRRGRRNARPPLSRDPAGGAPVRQDRNAQRVQRSVRLFDRPKRPGPDLLILRQRRAGRRQRDRIHGRRPQPDRRGELKPEQLMLNRSS